MIKQAIKSLSTIFDKPKVRARYDAAQDSRHNSEHFSYADGLSGNASASPDVRRKIRNRVRYEMVNNTYAMGIVKTLSNDVIGTCPRLQFGSKDHNLNKIIEDAWDAWANKINLGNKLRAMRIAKAVDGEAFAQLVTDPLTNGLEIITIEADQVQDGTLSQLGMLEPGSVDGIELDSLGRPAAYRVLPHHPGDSLVIHEEPITIPAGNIIHWANVTRPGQHRGVSELAPALTLFAQLRRFTLACLTAAETAADNALVVERTDVPFEAAVELEAYDAVSLERGLVNALPEGWKLSQVKSEQPATTYDMFKKEILNEIARCVNMPFNIAAGNSSDYNYASGRLDHQTYFKSLEIERHDCERVVLSKIMYKWFMQTEIQDTLRSAGLSLDDGIMQLVSYFWDGHEHVDPLKEAEAQKIRLESMTTSLAHECGRRGYDWRAQVDQVAEEREYIKQKIGEVITEMQKDTKDELPERQADGDEDE